MRSTPRTRVAVVTLGALLLGTAAAAPAAAADPSPTCSDALAPAVAAGVAADGYSYVLTEDVRQPTGKQTRTTRTYKRDNVHQRLLLTRGLYADATSWSQWNDPRTLSSVNRKALALLHKSNAHWQRRTTFTFRTLTFGDLPSLLVNGGGLPVTGTTTAPDGTTTITCSNGAPGSSATTTATVAATGRLATLVAVLADGVSGFRSRTEVRIGYRTPTVTAPSRADTVDVAQLQKARTAVLLPRLIRGLARSIRSEAYDVAQARGHARPTVGDIRHAARVTTAAYNTHTSAARRATVVDGPRGATVYAVAPITKKRVAYYVHRVGSQVLVTRR